MVPAKKARTAARADKWQRPNIVNESSKLLLFRVYLLYVRLIYFFLYIYICVKTASSFGLRRDMAVWKEIHQCQRVRNFVDCDLRLTTHDVYLGSRRSINHNVCPVSLC